MQAVCDLSKFTAMLHFLLHLWLDKMCMSLLSCLGLAACRDLRVRGRTGVVIECCMCAGLSLRSQELTALFLGVRLFCRCRLCTMPLSCCRLISGGR